MTATLYVIQAVIFFIIFFIGIIGNSIVLVVLLRQRSTWTITTTYVFNLAVADAVFVLFLPFWGHYHMNNLSWVFGLGMCKMIGAITYINMYASIFFLTAMSVDRWLAVVRATKMNVVRSTFVARCVCCCVWLSALLLSIPSFMYRELRSPRYFYLKQKTDSFLPTNTSMATSNSISATAFSNYILTTTSDVMPENEAMTYQCQFFIPSTSIEHKRNVHAAVILIRSLIGFILPMTAICICYIRIVMTVRHKVISRRVKKDRIARLAALIIGAFFVCWMPFHVMSMYSALGGWLKLFSTDGDFYLAVYPFTICLAYANSFVNPIVYAFSTTNFQENFKDICQIDYSAKPYRMTLANGDQHNDEKGLKTQITHLHTPADSPHCNSRCRQQVEVHRDKVEEDREDALQLLTPPPSQGATFSYYSCPAVVEGLGNAKSCYMTSGILPYSTPEKSNYSVESTSQDTV